MTKSRAFTLVELLVVIAIIGVLVGLAVPAMQNMREMSRRNHCQYNLTQLSLALSAYSVRYGHYPVGSLADSEPLQNSPQGFHHNWISGILPMLDAQNVADAIDRSVSVYDAKNDEVRMLSMPALQCPSASDIAENSSCYAGIASSLERPVDSTSDGVFVLNRPISDSDITDGLAYTIFLGEKLSAYEDDLGWLSGTRATLRSTGHAINSDRNRIRGPNSNQGIGPTFMGGLSSDHASGAYVVMGSGEFSFRSDSMDLRLLQQMANRSDGQLPAEWINQPVPVGNPEVPSSEPASNESNESQSTGASQSEAAATDSSSQADPQESSK